MRGGLCTLTVNSWRGDLPLPGQYLKAARGRTAFLIVEIVPAKPGARYRCKLRCERERPDRLHEGAVVWPWIWAKR